ncbi:MAG: IS21-like element helper ATPase IstB [Segatella salivae]
MLTVQRNGHVRLLGMYAAFKASQENFTLDKMTHDEFTSWLITNEWDDRCNRTIERLVKAADFRYEASLEHIDYDVDRELDRNLIQRLADLGFMSEGRNLFIVGSTGTGKSYIATALGYRACQKGHRVLYANTARLMAQLKVAKAKGSILQELKKIECTELLILDDFGLQPLDTAARNLLMDIIEDRHGKKSTIIASQIPVRAWYEVIADQTVADAIIDRIIHGAIKIQLKGESMRKKKYMKEKKNKRK